MSIHLHFTENWSILIVLINFIDTDFAAYTESFQLFNKIQLFPPHLMCSCMLGQHKNNFLLFDGILYIALLQV